MGAYRDQYLLEHTLKLKNQFNSNLFIETGTNDGDTVKILSSHFQELHTCEIVTSTYELAKTNLQYNSNVTVTNESSVIFLERICQKFQGRNDLIFFLDAHWDEYWPLLDELKIIKKYKFECPIIIHDFYVPDSKGNSKFNFDSYKNQKLDLNYVKNDIYDVFNGRYNIYYPDYVTEQTGYVVFTKQSTPFISYLVTTKNTGFELQFLLERLYKYGQYNECIILDDYSDNSDTLQILNNVSDNSFFKVHKHKLDKNYSEHKNYGKSLCKGEYIFQIDDDELPSETLLESLNELIKLNNDVDLFWIPRINDFKGVNNQNASQWGWKLTPYEDRLIVNWPDPQGRLFKNVSYIEWKRRLHEKVEGAKTYVHLPAVYELSLHHNKTIEKQIETNIKYNKLFTEEENKGFKV